MYFVNLQIVRNVFGPDGNKQLIGDAFIKIDEIVAITAYESGYDSDDVTKALVYVGRHGHDGWIEIPVSQSAEECMQLMSAVKAE